MIARTFQRLRHRRRDVSKAPPVFDWGLCSHVHPVQARDARGGHLIGENGVSYIDYCSAWGANILGYGYPAVAQAVSEQAARFCGVGMPYPGFWDFSNQIRQVVPGAQVIRFGKNGSDATSGAVRLARAVTGRDLVILTGKHAFHDWWMASVACAGVPAALRKDVLSVPSADPDSVRFLLKRHRRRIACLILDPMVEPRLSAAQAHQLLDELRSVGALLVLDEVVSGFRIAPGGMQTLWDIEPDLSCFGKAVANGMPLSVLAGPNRHMRHLETTNYGMTFEGEAVSLAAAQATVHEIVSKDVCGELARKGERLKAAFARMSARHGLQASLSGPSQRPHVAFCPHGNLGERPQRWLFLQEIARRGVLSVGPLSLCFSHTDDDLARTEAAFDQALAVVAQARDAGTVKGYLNEAALRDLQLD